MKMIMKSVSSAFARFAQQSRLVMRDNSTCRLPPRPQTIFSNNTAAARSLNTNTDFKRARVIPTNSLR